MGLAPYGEPRYVDLIKQKLIDIKDDGSFRLNLDYFDYCTGLTMTNARFDALFGGPPRKPEAPLTQREMDLAASVQAVTEEVVLKLAQRRRARDRRDGTSASPAAWRSIAWPTASCSSRAGSTNLWLQPAAGRRRRRRRRGIGRRPPVQAGSPGRRSGRRRHAGILSRARLFAGRHRAAAAGGRRGVRVARRRRR